MPTVSTPSHAPSRPGAVIPRSASAALLLAVAVLAGCATTQPVLYPTDSAQKESRATSDMQACTQLAQRDVGINARKGHETVARTGVLAATTAAVFSAVRGTADTANRALAAGVAGGVGGALKVALDWNEPDEVYEHYVEQCMRKRGHRVLGWR